MAKQLTHQDIHYRELIPSDLEWVIKRHGEIYLEEFDWNKDFENLVAKVALSYGEKHDPRFENAWIAEANGQRLGCIFLIKETDAIAKLRILLVERSARGLGIGSRLVKNCIEFSQRAGYKKIILWTNKGLDSARKIYEAEGFSLEKEEPHFSFGKQLVGQYWGKNLN